MRIHIFFLALVLQFGCKEKRSYPIQVPPQEIEEKWEIKSRDEYSHTYTSDGLLDTTIKLSTAYFEGRKIVSHTTLICRKYDQRKNLVREKHYQFSGKQVEVETELGFVYDAGNRVVKKTEFNYGKLYSVVINKYDEKGRLAVQESKIENLSKWFLENPDQYLTGEAGKNRTREYIKHRERYIYNSFGDLSEIRYIDSTGQTSTKMFLYENDKLKTSFFLDERNDTTDIKTYKEVEGFIIESRLTGNYKTILYKKDGKTYKAINISPGMKDKSEFVYNGRGELIMSTDFNAY